MRKIFSTLLVVLMASFVVLAGCSSNSKNASVNSKGKTVVTAFTSKTPNISSFNNNLLTQEIEKKLNIDIQFQAVPLAGADKKQSLLLASGDYPDAFIGGNFSGIQQLKYGKSGVFIPLNHLIQKYAPHIQQAFKKEPWLKKAITMPDGNIYGLPGITGCYHCTYPIKMWMNKTWLKKLNLKMPTTTKQFEKVLKAFKNGDPNGDGKKDEIPLSGQPSNQQQNPINFLMNAFIYTDPSTYLQVKNGKISFVADTPQWKQGLTYIRKLYSEGLIDPQTFTQNQESLQQLGNKPNTPTLGTFPALWSGGVLTISKQNEKLWTKYVAVPPLKGPSGLQQTMYNGNTAPSAKFAITKKANKKQQIAAIKIADFVYSKKGALDEMFGVGGWSKPKKGDKGANGKPAVFRRKISNNVNQPTNVLWDNDFCFVPVNLYDGQAASQDIHSIDGYERFLYLQTKNKYAGHRPKEVMLNNVVDPSKAQTVAEMETQIVSDVQKNAVQFIIGKKSLSSDWQAYVKGLKNLGVDKYVKIYQNAYNSKHK